MNPEQIARLKELCEFNRELTEDELTEYRSLKELLDDEDAQAEKVAAERAELAKRLGSTNDDNEAGIKVRVDQTEDGDAQRGAFDKGVQFNVPKDPFDLSTVSVADDASKIRGRAETAIERMNDTDDEIRSAATATLRNVQGDPGGITARRMLATGSVEYRSAFMKIISNRPWAVTPEEARVMERAASLTDAAGGFAIPFTLDPTIVLTNVGVSSPFREICRTVQITTDSWQGVTSAGVTASYDAEAAEVSDDAPTLAQPAIPVHKAQAFVPFSIEIGQDWPGMQADIAMMFADARDRLEGTAFVTGTGSDQPTGIRTELLAGASEVDTATAEVLAVTDISSLYAALPPRHRNMRTAAIAEWSTLVEIRRLLAAADDRSSFNEATASQPATLFGWPIYESSAVDAFSDVDATASAVHLTHYVADWSNYVIVDRIGMNVELIPHLFATANNRPSGQRGFYAWWRNGAESINDDAFRVTTITTTA